MKKIFLLITGFFINLSLFAQIDATKLVNKAPNTIYDTNFVAKKANLTPVVSRLTTVEANYVNGTALNNGLSAKVDKTTTVNAKPLTGPISITALDVGLGNVSNISVVNAPISTATQNALNAIPGSALPSYEGFIATRGQASDNSNSSATVIMSESIHFATQNITSLKVAIPNFYVAGGSNEETGLGSTATVKVSIDYPINTTQTQLLFSGSLTGSIPNKSILISDYLNVNIPLGAKFGVRIYFQNAGGIYFASNQNTQALGSGQTNGSGTTDLTMSGTVPSSSVYFPPLAVIGYTTKPSVVIVGDSKSAGVGEGTVAPQDATGDYGEIAKGLNRNFGYVNLGIPGQSLANFLASSPLQRLLFTYATHVINAYQFNDFWANSQTAATGQTQNESFQTLVHALTGNKKVFNITIGPRTTSTDNWATLANQTTYNSTTETERVKYNTYIRNGNNGQDGFIDLASIEESSFNSGKYQVNGSPNYFTADGIHESQTGNQIFKASLKNEIYLKIMGYLK